MSEHDDQAAVISWCKYMAGQYPKLELLYATPNQGKRSYAAARYMLDEGLRSGVPDLCMPVPSGKYHGMYIEMKIDSKQSKLTENQRWWIDKLREQGYKVVVCRGFQKAIDEICDYLGIEE